LHAARSSDAGHRQQASDNPQAPSGAALWFAGKDPAALADGDAGTD
jgi:hypothetical protein